MRECLPALSLAIVLVASLTAATSACAGWKSIGPDGGNIPCLAMDPQDPRTIYAGTGDFHDGAGVFKSTDGGKTWRHSGLMGCAIQTVLIDPHDTQVVYTLVDDGILFKSTNGGKTWTKIAVSLGSINSVAMDPRDGQTLYMSARWHLYKSTDGGDTWKQSDSGLSDDIFEFIAVDPGNTQTVYASSWDYDLFRSTDGGMTWKRTSLDGAISMAFDPEDIRTIYVVTKFHYVYKSEDAGDSWSDITPREMADFLEINSLALNPKNPRTVYATSSAGVLKSLNGGITWKWANTGLTETHACSIAINPRSTSSIYVGTAGGGIFKSQDRAETWEKSGPRSSFVTSFALDPVNTRTLYTGTENDGIFRSTDGGNSWRKLAKHFNEAPVYSLVTVPKKALTVYAICGSSAYRSRDGGKTWSSLMNESIDSLAIDPKHAQTLYAGGSRTNHHFYYRLLKSTDRGKTWNTSGLRLAENIDHIAIDPKHTNIIYAGTDGYGVYKSVDGGKTWKQMASTKYMTITCLAIDPNNTQIVYAGAVGYGVLKSTDGGSTGEICLRSDFVINSLAINPQDSRILYAGAYGGGVFKSEDGGDDWEQANLGLMDMYVSSLTIDPQEPQTVYAGTYGGGVFKTTDGALGRMPHSVIPTKSLMQRSFTHADENPLWWQAPTLRTSFDIRYSFLLARRNFDSTALRDEARGKWLTSQKNGIHSPTPGE